MMETLDVGRALVLSSIIRGRYICPAADSIVFRADDLLASVFPEASAVSGNIVGATKTPALPCVVDEVMMDVLTEAMEDIHGR